MIPGVSPLEGLLSAQRLGPQANIGTQTAAIDPGSSFGTALANASQRTMETLRGAEGVSMQALQGEVPAREVVDAVMSAERALQTSIAIRDKIVSAWLELSRMQI